MTTKERILDLTIKLFLDKGCKSLTMDQIASENGISKRTLYELFTDKSTLLEECIIRFHNKKNEAVSVLRKDSKNVLELLLKIAQNYNQNLISLPYDFYVEVRRYYPQTFENVVTKMSAAQYAIVQDMMAKGQEEGVFLKRLSTKSMAIALMQMSNSNSEYGIYDFFNIHYDQYVRDIMLHVLRGFSTEKGIKIIDDYYNKN